MRVGLKLVVCLFMFSATAICQERITKMMAGPSNEQFRIIVSLLEVTDDRYNLQSMIIDVNPVKKKEQPTSYYVDLTTTIRNLQTGDKQQRILVLRWDKSQEIEVKCDGGKWVRQTTGPELDKIAETVRTVVQNSPLDSKKVIDFTLPKELEQKVIGVLNSLGTSKLQCIRGGS